jgi:peptide deformylase
MSEPLEFRLSLFPAPVLRKVASPVVAFDEGLARIVEAMFRRMRESRGVGLAAPQVGLDRRILVLNPTGEEADDLVLVNPTITGLAGEPTLFDEGCLSFPGIFAQVRRPERCTVEAFDVAGQRIEREFDGFTSRIVQHEHDHLEGILLVDRMAPADKVRNKAALAELVDAYRDATRRAAAARP